MNCVKPLLLLFSVAEVRQASFLHAVHNCRPSADVLLAVLSCGLSTQSSTNHAAVLVATAGDNTTRVEWRLLLDTYAA